jgi:hypothetical protein
VRLSVLILAVAGVLGLPAAASADLPSFAGSVIVPGASAGGVKLGMAADTAIARWGGSEDCPKPFTGYECRWRAASGGASATLIFKNGKVAAIALRVGTTSTGNPVFKGPLMKLKLRRKVGLRSTLGQILRVYPKLRGSPSGAALGSGSRTTTFSTSGGRVTEIVVGTVP